MDDALRDEITQVTCDLIRIDTTNPPGRETAAATFLKGYLEREGIECELVAREPDRANLVARIPGTGDGPSLALLGHTDVVYADPDDWQVDPFGGVVRDDHVWGRGALDMKQHTAANCVAFALLARSGFRPRGDLLLIAEADEEDGIDHVGLDWLVQQRRDLRTDYAINEGGGERLVLADGRVVYLFASAEKATMPVRVTVRGVAGHASTPAAGDNALVHLAPVIQRLAAYQPERHLQQELAGLLDVVAPDGSGEGLDARLARAQAAHPYLDVLVPPMSCSTMTPTMAAASRKRNVVPARAEVICDCRVLPGTDAEQLFSEFHRAIDGLRVELELEEPPSGGTRSALGTPLERACRDFVKQLEPGAELAPSMCVGFTNSHFVRDAFGTTAYGFLPMRYTDASVVNETIHAPDERVHQDDLIVAVRFLEHVAREIGGLR
jgi:acetylornithine deacetylase/succinyl-diaminopimelate desuccinylase-like protein